MISRARRVMHQVLPALAFALAATSCCVSPIAAADNKGGAVGATHAVTIDATSFQPALLVVRSGDKIVWTNKDPFPHTVTSKSGGFDSGQIAPGQSWQLTPTKKGEFAYVCTFHPAMKATLRVE